MPRLYTDPNVHGEREAMDYCLRCWQAMGDSDEMDDHPSYADEEYECDRCGKRLTAKDD